MFQKILSFSTFCDKNSFFRGSQINKKSNVENVQIKKNKNKKRKRCENRKTNLISRTLNIFAANAAGIKSKYKSFEKVLLSLKPQIFMLQETKLRANEVIKCETSKDFQIFHLNRQNKQGGGLAVGIEKRIESTLIREGDDNTEVLSIQIIVEKTPVRIIVGYGPQENDDVDRKKLFWNFVENEVKEAEAAGDGIIFQMDGNLHAGCNLIKNDPNPINKNGRLFLEFLSRNKSLIVLNSLESCEGVITRQRKVENRTEQAVLDFFLINEKLRPFLEGLLIDENRDFGLCNTAQIRKNGKIIDSDHNSSIATFNIQINNREKVDRQEMFNLRNKKCQEAFKDATENSSELVKTFRTDLPFEKQTKIWQKIFNSLLYKCFKKVRIVGKNEKEEHKMKIFEMMKEMTHKKKQLKKTNINIEMKEMIKSRIKAIEDDIKREVSEENIKHVMESLRELGGEGNSLKGEGRNKMWKILQKNYPKHSSAVPVGKKDRSGNIITNHTELKHLYLKTYMNRLRSRPMKPEFEELKIMKNELFDLRLQASKSRKSDPWTLNNLENAIKGLKNEKARDPNGLVNEIFKEGVAGKDFKISLLTFFNKMKEENIIPDFVRYADVATIYKGKGEKCNLENDRGIFIVSIYRSILMRLIYLDTYETLDKSISDSQVGGRKGKSVRNHIWILNGVICDVLSKKKNTPVDLQIFDYKQCFDTLWIEECMNDVYVGGLRDDKFALLYNVNKIVKVAVKTPVGKTDRRSIYNSIIQGDVFSPMFCGKHIDGIGKDCLESSKYTYQYKGMVDIPPLIMLDDLITISECGHKTAMVNAYVKAQTSSKKLQFGNKKCKKIHIGKTCEDFKCHNLYLDKWTEKEVEDYKTKDIIIEDICEEEERMEDTEMEKYLGHVISRDGRNINNIKARVSKGTGIVHKILTMLDGIPFGMYYFEAAVILRESLLASSVLCTILRMQN